MHLDTAYVCYSCRRIQDRVPTGKCSTCFSENIYPLGWIGRKKKDRVKWLKRIGVLRANRKQNEEQAS